MSLNGLLAPRFNMYGPIHKALRLFMGDTLARCGRLDWEDPAELAEVSGQVEALVGLLGQHLAHEDRFIHPFMQARQAGSAAQAGAEHHDHQEALAALALEARLLREQPGEAQAARVYQDLALLVADNLQHMQMEETAHHQCLWQHASDAELRGLHERLVSSIPPEEMMLTLSWMLPALAPRERAGLLLGMREGAPAPVFAAVLELAERRLDPQGWAKLKAALERPAEPLAA